MPTRRVVQRGPRQTDVPRLPARAAQYLRMSTDHQKYSTENQRIAIAAYAAQRNIEIVRTYIDEGRSGLSLIGRDGLRELINDVQLDRADFDRILVYDISRWGRFQDVDESAYYEFICRRAGINVHYCAEEFENDGSLASIVLKSISRVGAADFSRKLSKRVFLGQCHTLSLGFWRGGPPGYGLRRLSVDETRMPRALLEHGEQKHFKADRVILVPGPPSEVDTVRRIFNALAIEKKTRTEIATELNAEGICNAIGNPWQMQTIDILLRNEAYLGHNVFNRRSSKLQQKSIENPREMWIRCDNAFEAIISPKLFSKAQQILDEQKYGRRYSDEQLLDMLRRLWRKKGHLSTKLIENATHIPSTVIYARRFGSVLNAYRLIGYETKRRYHFKESAAKLDAVMRSVADDITAHVRSLGGTAHFIPELRLLTLNGSMTIVLVVAWSVSDGVVRGARARRWEVRQIKYKRADLMLVVRMNASNEAVRDYFLLPADKLPLTKDHKKLRVSVRSFYDFRHTIFADVLRAIEQYSCDRLPTLQLILDIPPFSRPMS